MTALTSITYEGKEYEVVDCEALLAEVKPIRDKDGNLWRSRRPMGNLATCADGSMFYSENNGAWEKL